MDISGYVREVSGQGAMLVNAAYFGGLDAAVPTCPAWRARDLLHHMGYVHRWATRYVADQVTDMMPELTEAEQLAACLPDETLLDWYLDGLKALVDALASADPGLRAWTFLPAASPLAFWARRQAHETAIHCADAKLAAGVRHAYQAEFAADGIDELLIAFFGRESVDPATVAPSGGTRALLVRATDTGQDWHVRLSQDGDKIITTGRGPCLGDSAACTLTGPASGLYLLLWNRADPDAARVTVSGDDQVLRAWRDEAHLTWA